MANPIGVNYMQRTDIGIKGRLREFYRDVLGWELQEISPTLDIFSPSEEMTYGVAYLAAGSDALSDEQFRGATWMAIRADDRTDLVSRIRAFGVTELPENSDEDNFFFQAPGGQVYVC